MTTAKRQRPERKKLGSYHHGNLREALLQAAVKRIADSQDFDFRLRDLAADCGVRLAATYRHFESKADVLVELARRGFVALAESLSAERELVDPASALTDLGIRYILFAQANPVLYMAMFHPALQKRGPHPDFDAAAIQAITPLRNTVERILGTRRLGSTSAGTLVLQAWAGVHGYASLLVSQQSKQPSTLVGQGSSKRAIANYVEAHTRGLLGV